MEEENRKKETKEILRKFEVLPTSQLKEAQNLSFRNCLHCTPYPFLLYLNFPHPNPFSLTTPWYLSIQLCTLAWIFPLFSQYVILIHMCWSYTSHSPPCSIYISDRSLSVYYAWEPSKREDAVRCTFVCVWERERENLFTSLLAFNLKILFGYLLVSPTISCNIRQ